MLCIFDPELPNEQNTDPSSIGYGGVLLKIFDSNNGVIGYFSKLNTKTEDKYYSYELETLAVI